MRAHWALLEEEWFRFTGPDWLLLLLDRCPTEQQDHVKLILWRARTVYNNITHQSGSSLISDSVFFLLNYSESCEQAKKKEAVVSSKGKEPCSRSDNRASADVQRWKPPPVGWSKINFDGSFVEHTGEAGVGIIARNHQGEVIFTAWRCVPQCTSAIEAEANACLEGVRFATQWIQGPVVFETDCARVHNALSNNEDRSEISFLIGEAKEHTRLLEDWGVLHAKRECNHIAHELAQLGRRSANAAAWIGRAPACVTDLISADYISVSSN
jgi:ribonuclease HI